MDVDRSNMSDEGSQIFDSLADFSEESRRFYISKSR
jgi:hypothetical protein